MHRRSFTLLELILVVAILAALAGVATSLVDGVQDQANGDIARREMCAIRDALLRFHRDTGWLPGEGPFDLETRGGAVPPARVQAEGVAAGSEQPWFDSAANAWQLLENPLLGTPHPLGRWDPDRRRGWNGPYLSMDGEGEVQAGFVDGRAPALSGDLSAAPLLPWAPAIADPFLRSTSGTAELPWHSRFDASLTLSSQGRPYLLCLPRDPLAPAPQPVVRLGPGGARVVGLGPDGQLGGGDDLVVHLFQ